MSTAVPRRPLRPGVLLAPAALLAALTAGAGPLAAQHHGSAGDGSSPVPVREEAAEWRFPVGERAVYDVTFGPVKVGRGALVVEAIDTVSATPAYRVSFEIEGGTFFYKVDDRSVSWVAPDPLRSLRFEQILREGDYRRHRRYVLDHSEGTYSREDWDYKTNAYRPNPETQDVPMPDAALDEIAYLYLARSLPLEPGRTYTFERYFEEEGNPARLEVLRRETVRVPAGRFETVVVRPVIQAGGMFGEGGRAEVYITDDERRAIVLLRTKMKVGELNMYLRHYEPGRAGETIRAAAR